MGGEDLCVRRMGHFLIANFEPLSLFWQPLFGTSYSRPDLLFII